MASNRRRIFSVNDAKDLYRKSNERLKEVNALLSEARVICNKAGLSVDSSILDASYQSPFLSTPLHLKNHNNNGNNNGNSISHVNGSNTKESSSSRRMEAVGIDNNNHNNTNTTGSSEGGISCPSTTLFRSKSFLSAFPPILSTTGGHSNTDHIIQVTGDYRADTIAEYKRRLKRRARAMQPEERGSDRWDQPRIQGSRRRRIAREKDLPSAPPEPPPSGYVLFIAQMTTKIRHDRPNAHHNQIKVVREISKIWKYGMNDADREYYNEFAREAREEYERQHEEFRATGSYQPSRVFTRLGGGDGPWVRIAEDDRNALEREISNYGTVKFPPRPEHVKKPEWVTKIEKQNEREARKRKEREERTKREMEEKLKELKEASQAKMKRLGQVNVYKGSSTNSSTS
mmetsp:Transcript_7998/g.15063  ORF Transcript_7998/g.15063 Transcript_7998/m.15063 type:complete len:401 (-) Transcript_7998:40-1242(-)|eukprot:CAMPEP_0176483552 /NCGR_PEP_ID=MMETSP0200_2-20121128/3981_1 /TAXON_ID=947934 /ORGANISM="Chaetoceros sp., Strain GSL56" /LENGTH=400 /DNA_ID=CAMNT_0017879965 /DNA_START=145 /DNA_END=1347 /DNA_ORIENTATION=-